MYPLKTVFLKALLLPYKILLLSAALTLSCTAEVKEKSADDTSVPSAVSPLAQLPADEAGNVVRKAIEAAGGWEHWADKETLSYIKVIQFFDSIGVREREVRQLHQYQLHPLKVRISWDEAGEHYTVINNGQQVWKLKNDQPLTASADADQAWNTSFGSHYVMCMPFKLTDPGTVLTYQGLDTLDNGRVVHAVKTTYQEGAGSAAGKHTWWYYFDQDDYRLAANFLEYGNGFSYTQYEAFADVQGIRLNEKRKSYSTNADRDLKYVETVYSNENIQFDVTLEDTLFAPPQ